MYDRRLRRKADKQFIVVLALLFGLTFLLGLSIGYYEAAKEAGAMILNPAKHEQEAAK